MTYKRFTSRQKLSDVLHANYYLLPVVHRFDIRFGIGDLTIGAICRRHGIDAEFFTEILNVYNDEFYFPEKILRRLDVRLIVGYIRKTHQYYVDYLLPTIEEMTQRLVRSGGRRNRSLGPIGRLFSEYRTEFVRHIENEERNVLPYALRISDLHAAGAKTPVTARQVSSIRSFEDEHAAMDEKLLDLKNLLIKYIEQPFDAHLCNAIIFELDRLERDARDHARIEDRILFAAVERMEAALKKRTRPARKA